MRGPELRLLALAFVLLCFASPAAAQQDSAQGSLRSWSTGEPSPLPVRIRFYSSRPDNVLDSAAVLDAAEAAMFSSRLPPDARLVEHDPALEGPYLRVEVDVYSGDGIRFGTTLIDAGGEPRRGCHAESRGGSRERLTAALFLSHEIRDALECVRRRYELGWPSDDRDSAGGAGGA